MRALTTDEIDVVSAGFRLDEAAAGFVALGGALALAPFVVAAGVAFAGAAVLEGLYLSGV